MDLPRIFWALNFVMGLSRGCDVYSLEGQTGTAQVPAGWSVASRGLPPDRLPAAHWTTEGELTPVFHRYIAPVIRGLIEHQLIPTKDQLLANIRLAVYNDGAPKKAKTDPYYYEWEDDNVHAFHNSVFCGARYRRPKNGYGHQ
jgi:hypothetical protein